MTNTRRRARHFFETFFVFWVSFCTLPTEAVPEKWQIQGGAPAISFVFVFMVLGLGFIVYSAYRHGSRRVRNTGRSARHFFKYLLVCWVSFCTLPRETVPEKWQIQGGALSILFYFLTILGLILAHFGSLLQLCWPPWTSFGPPWTSFGQPWVPCGQKFPPLGPIEVTFQTPK